MAPSLRDRLSVDLHGLKAELLERAKALGITPSGFVRATLAEALGRRPQHDVGRPTLIGRPGTTGRVRLCLRMNRDEAQATLGAARRAGMSPGDYVGGLVLNVPALTACGSRADHIATLVTSSAELSTLSRNIHRLSTLLRQANAEPAKQYRQMLDTLTVEVRAHLRLASRVLAELRPQSRRAAASALTGRRVERAASCPKPRT